MKLQHLVLIVLALFVLSGCPWPPPSSENLSPLSPPPSSTTPSPMPTPHSDSTPSPAPTPYPTTCGNGSLDMGEECDATARPTGCKDDERCNDYCTCVKVQITPECGDGLITAPEQCDPKSQLSNYGCGPGEMCSGCRCEVAPPTYESMVCGDGKVTGIEECDPVARPTGCADDERCDSYCKCVKVQITPGCGDGKVTGTEECDPTARPTGCADDERCDSYCKCVKVQITPECGDGKITPPEQCDPGSASTSSVCGPDGVCSGCVCVKTEVQHTICGDGACLPPQESCWSCPSDCMCPDGYECNPDSLNADGRGCVPY
jgi:hypothetical protein